MVNNKDKFFGGSNAGSYPDNASIIAGIDAALIAIKAGGAGGHISVGRAAGQPQVERSSGSYIFQETAQVESVEDDPEVVEHLHHAKRFVSN